MESFDSILQSCEKTGDQADCDSKAPDENGDGELFRWHLTTIIPDQQSNDGAGCV